MYDFELDPTVTAIVIGESAFAIARSDLAPQLGSGTGRAMAYAGRAVVQANPAVHSAMDGRGATS